MKRKIFSFIMMGILVVGNINSVFAAQYATCIGRNFNDGTVDNPNLDTTIPTNIANRHFTNAGYDATSYTTPTIKGLNGKNDAGVYRMSCDILYFNGEGDGTYVAWWNGTERNDECGVFADERYSKDNYYTLTSSNYNKNDLIMFMACKTSPMAKYAEEVGNVPSTVGFNYKVPTNDLSIWSQRFTLALSNGQTLAEAAQYADADERYTKNTTVTSHYIGGRNNRIVEDTRNIESYKLDDFEFAEKDELPTDDEINYGYVRYDVRDNILYPNDDNYDDIVDYILNNINSNFDINNFKIEKESDDVIRFHRMIGDIRADAGYILYFKNGALSYIAKSGNVDVDLDIDELQLEKYNLATISDDMFEYEGYTIIDQSQEKRINSYTKELYTEVVTSYINDETGAEIAISEKI